MVKKTVFGILVGVMFCCACGIVSAEPVTLRYKYKVGDVDTYKASVTTKKTVKGAPGAHTAPETFDMSMPERGGVWRSLGSGSARIRVVHVGFQNTSAFRGCGVN